MTGKLSEQAVEHAAPDKTMPVVRFNTATARPLRLLVVMVDPLSAILRKGEIVPRYYNPTDLFDEIHFLLLNDDRPDRDELAKLCGRASPVTHNLMPPRHMILRTLGWRPFRLRSFAARAVNMTRSIGPSVVRSFNPWLDGFVAAEIKAQFGIPFVISLHGNMDEDYRNQTRPEGGLAGYVHVHTARTMERQVLRAADTVVCVYRFIEPYARKHGVHRIETIYNAVASDAIRVKQNYRLSQPPRLVLPGRQLPQKDPRPILRALARIPGPVIDLIGSGPIHHELPRLATELGIAARCRFFPSMANAELCQRLADYDLLLSVNNYGGVSKVELEAAFAGMPIITNRHALEAEPELLGENCLVVEHNVDAWTTAIRSLLDDHAHRERLGRALRASIHPYEGSLMEKRQGELYASLMGIPAQT
jgi:glycosyltransferase involved in cell wall biosynthesis